MSPCWVTSYLWALLVTSSPLTSLHVTPPAGCDPNFGGCDPLPVHPPTVCDTPTYDLLLGVITTTTTPPRWVTSGHPPRPRPCPLQPLILTYPLGVCRARPPSSSAGPPTRSTWRWGAWGLPTTSVSLESPHSQSVSLMVGWGVPWKGAEVESHGGYAGSRLGCPQWMCPGRSCPWEGMTLNP